MHLKLSGGLALRRVSSTSYLERSIMGTLKDVTPKEQLVFISDTQTLKEPASYLTRV
jgi:hypothetical protein